MKKRFFTLFFLIITLFALTVNADDFFADGKNIYSDHVYMVNTDTGKVVYELDSETLTYPASLTKVMTCILAIEHCESLDEIVTMPSGIFDDVYAGGGVNMQLKTGEEVTVGDLIRATMIRSTCDTANALAWYVSGSIEAFAEKMNAKAIEIGATNTHFVNAHGLHHNNHYSTAKDMYLIAEYALKNQTFCDIIKGYTCTIPATNKSEERVLSTTIEIENPESPLYYPYVTGVKSGFTDEAGRCLITRATKDGETYLLVTLGANRDRYYDGNMAFTDAVTLFEYHFAQYSIETVLNNTDVLGKAKVAEGTVDEIDVRAENEISTLIALDDSPVLTLNIDEKLTAPISAGEKVGTVTVQVGDETFTEALIATVSVAKKSKTKTFSELNDGNTAATVMDILSITICVTTVIILVVFLIKVSKRKKSNK